MNKKATLRSAGIDIPNDDPLASEKIYGIDAMWGLWVLHSTNERRKMAEKIAACTSSGQICILMRQVRDEM
jgi:hypothetical protein